MLNTPTHGSIQYHPSLLPRHRGPSAINWAIIQGDPKTGIAIFWPDDGLDTGPVLMLREVEIAPDDTLGSLYFDKLFPLGVEAMVESVDLVREGRAPKLVQDEAQATYESWCRKADAEIDWSRPVADVYNLIRGANPQPGAWTTVGSEQVEVLDSERVDGDPGAPPGQVVTRRRRPARGGRGRRRGRDPGRARWRREDGRLRLRARLGRRARRAPRRRAFGRVAAWPLAWAVPP